MLPVPGSQFVRQERGRTRVQEQGGSGEAHGRSKPLAFSPTCSLHCAKLPLLKAWNKPLYDQSEKWTSSKYICTLLGRSEHMLPLG